MDLGDVTDTFNTIYLTGGGGAVAGTPAATRSDRSDLQNHIFRAGLNYHLMPTGPARASAGPLLALHAPRLDWAGYYVGANLGYGIGRDPTTRSSVDAAGTPTYGSPQEFVLAPEGWLGGVQVGGNRTVFNPNWILGFEADIQATGMKDTANCIPIACGGRIVSTPGTGLFPVAFSDYSAEHKLNWFGTFRGRVGYAAGHGLVYATAGLAYGEVERRGSIAGRTVGAITGTTINTFAGAYSASSTQVGWTGGGGVEARLTDQWTGKVEYLYVDLGGVSDSFNTVFLTGGAGVSGSHTFSTHIREHIVRFGANYHLTPL
jgi:outer membrane immunogenic protein